MVFKGLLCLIAAGGLSLAALGQNTPGIAPVPADPLELVTGPIQIADTPASREPVLLLLARARNSYAVQSAGLAYDLKVAFTASSGGQTEYDGAWEMEDVFDPQQGLRWTAKAAAAYAATQISSNNMYYREGTDSVVPLRLQEARAALLDPIPSWKKADRGLVRTSTATFHGVQVVCILLSGSGSAAAATGRRWEETEECIDPQSGLLQVHSQVPGRYYAYDYSNAARLGDAVLPRKVTVTEAGRVVSEISVDSLLELPAADPRLFVPTAEMKARGPAIAMGGAQKITRLVAPGPFPSGAAIHPVCVFGLVTASGKLVEAHSLQPSDPNSQAALEAAKRINFAAPVPRGARAQQHFVFILEKFAASK